MASCGKQDTIIAWSCSKLLHGFSMMTWRLVMLSVLCQALGQDDKAALIIIDVQDCFLESGTLPVPEGKEVIPVINRIRSAYEDAFSMVVLSQDWHCSDHVSFASQHPGHRPFDEVTLQYDSKGHLCTSSSVPPSFPYAHACSQVRYNISQSLWPDHCIMNVTSGPTSSAIDSRLTRKPNDEIILKGNDCEVDSYSAFNSNGGLRHTRLHRLLQRNNISVVYVVGLALDYCVYYTSLDAHSLGYKTYTVADATRGIAVISTQEAVADLKTKGVHVIQSSSLAGLLSVSGAPAASM
ncbi:nicotinamidase-like isoform X2 [Haliotis rubra]|uniref:nicotinamidase-like isoform X2 n=1 Tax=Haliotis rubra TaxID=36100 RepID=UPI001EE57764|nr:nicotinamidase-like isoform X2 [Haliotis rubra]